ncbi:MAG: substrate-binding periplasmic protein [Solirubrobacterales bacterium]
MKVSRLPLVCLLGLLLMLTSCGMQPPRPDKTPLKATPQKTSANRVVIEACEWEPYTGTKLSGKGFLSEIAVAALTERGYEVEIRIVPWARALKDSKTGVCDGLLGASYTEERKAFLDYPDAIWVSNMVLFGRKGRNVQYTKIEALAPATIGVLNGSLTEKLIENVKGIKVVKVANVEQNVKMLALGRIDYMIDIRDGVEYLLNGKLASLKDQVMLVNPPIFKDNLYLAFSKRSKRPLLARDFNMGLKAIKANGTYDRIVTKHGMTVSR